MTERQRHFRIGLAAILMLAVIAALFWASLLPFPADHGGKGVALEATKQLQQRTKS